jgi:PAS domain S-box-containing protein
MKEINLFEKDEINFSTKFLKLMDILVSNKAGSRLECYILFGIYYIQILSGFFAYEIGVFSEDSNCDYILNLIYKIFRIKQLFLDNYSGFKIILILLFIGIIGFTVYFLFNISKMNKNTLYGYKELIMNFIIKAFLYILFIPILDLCLANICFSDDSNPNFYYISCKDGDTIAVFIGVILFFYNIFLGFFINIFYTDTHFLSNSCYSKMSYPYYIYLTLSNIIFSILLSQVGTMGKEVFLFYNLIVSLIFLRIIYHNYIFYDNSTNMLVGIFHILWVWTSIFFVIFFYINSDEKGVIYIIGGIIVCYVYFNLRSRFEEDIMLKKPFHKIDNKHYLLYYMKNLLEIINNFEANPADKAKLIGIIDMHISECPNPECPTKHKDKMIYLPISDEWTDRSKTEVNDKVYLFNLLLFIINYFINQSFYSADMLINLSLYYITVIGNYCQAIVIYKKIKDMKLSIIEQFSFSRLRFLISKTFVDKLKPPNEGCPILEDLNCSLYFKYNDLSRKFYEEINRDINLSLEFWKCFKIYNETGRPLDFNKIFSLTDNIRLTKIKIEKIWNDLFSTYSGVNDLFELYQNYVETINDDDLTKRDLDTIRSKYSTSTEHIQINFYNTLFNKETGIIIANGDKGKEGIIEKTNDDIEKIFLYKADELKGLNLTIIMPKLFQANHHTFMERFANIGEKRIIDKNFHAYAKDKENTLIPVGLCIKLFPMLSDHIFYCGMIFKEASDDVILLDSNFNIQGMSKRLLQKFDIECKTIFFQIDLPFFVICKDFIEFFHTYVKPRRNNINNNIAILLEKEEKKNDEVIVDENLNMINENLELEYELCIPQFFYNYVSIVNKRDNKVDLNYVRSNTNVQEHESNDFDEADALVDENQNDNSNINQAKHTDEDKEILNKIHQMRQLFKNEKYEDLADMIDAQKKEGDSKVHKFIFNFSIHKYAQNHKAFVIRYVENKNEYVEDGSDDSEDTQKGNKMTGRTKVCREGKLQSLVDMNEITHDDKETMINSLAEYASLSRTNRDFQKMSSIYRQEISDYSKIFGIQKEDASKFFLI